MEPTLCPNVCPPSTKAPTASRPIIDAQYLTISLDNASSLHRANSFRAAGVPSASIIHIGSKDPNPFVPAIDLHLEDRKGLVIRSKSLGIYDQDRSADRFSGDMSRWIVADLATQSKIAGFKGWDSAIRATGLSAGMYQDPDTLSRAEGLLAYQRIEAEAKMRNLPKHYQEDLTTHDHHLLSTGTMAPTKFGWVLRNCGTQLIDPRTDRMNNDKESYGLAVANAYKHESFYLYDGTLNKPLIQVNPDKWIEQLKDWRSEAEKLGETSPAPRSTRWTRQWALWSERERANSKSGA